MERKPSERHNYSNRENAADLKQWRGSSSEGTGLCFIPINVTTMPRICGDGAGGTRDIKRELCNSLSARVGNILRPAEGDTCESVGDLQGRRVLTASAVGRRR